MKQSLAPHTGRIFEEISKMESIKPFILVGGTALSLQLNTRQSEDLDFMRWKENSRDNLDIGWPGIKKELATIGQIQDEDIAGFDQASFIVDGVKISFYAAPRKRIPTMQEIQFMNNLRLADIESIAIMKMETMMRRNKFRDYYDIYSILKTGADINKLISLALEHSGHRLKSKNLMAMLTNGQLFRKDENFSHLQPKYNVSSEDIEKYIKSLLERDHVIRLNNNTKVINSESYKKIDLLSNIVKLIIDRASDPTAKSFDDESKRRILNYLAAHAGTTDEKVKLATDLWNEADVILSKNKIEQAWRDDTKEELLDLAKGRERSQSLGWKW